MDRDFVVTRENDLRTSIYDLKNLLDECLGGINIIKYNTRDILCYLNIKCMQCLTRPINRQKPKKRNIAWR